MKPAKKPRRPPATRRRLSIKFKPSEPFPKAQQTITGCIATMLGTMHFEGTVVDMSNPNERGDKYGEIVLRIRLSKSIVMEPSR